MSCDFCCFDLLSAMLRVMTGFKMLMFTFCLHSENHYSLINVERMWFVWVKRESNHLKCYLFVTNLYFCKESSNVYRMYYDISMLWKFNMFLLALDYSFTIFERHTFYLWYDLNYFIFTTKSERSKGISFFFFSNWKQPYNLPIYRLFIMKILLKLKFSHKVKNSLYPICPSNLDVPLFLLRMFCLVFKY